MEKRLNLLLHSSFSARFVAVFASPLLAFPVRVRPLSLARFFSPFALTPSQVPNSLPSPSPIAITAAAAVSCLCDSRSLEVVVAGGGGEKAERGEKRRGGGGLALQRTPPSLPFLPLSSVPVVVF